MTRFIVLSDEEIKTLSENKALELLTNPINSYSTFKLVIVSEAGYDEYMKGETND